MTLRVAVALSAVLCVCLIPFPAAGQSPTSQQEGLIEIQTDSGPPRPRRVPVVAETTPPALPASTNGTNAVASGTAPEDFGKGFDLFVRFGLPDVSKGRYVKLQVRRGYLRLNEIGYSYNAGFKCAGNAWLVREDKQGKSQFVAFDGGKTVEVYDLETVVRKEDAAKKAAAAKKEKTAPTPVVEAGELVGKWSDADPRKDLRSITNFLGRVLAEQSGEGRSRLYFDQSSADNLLLAAAHFYQAGFKSEANEIVRMLFEIHDERKKIVLQAVGSLAAEKYEDATDRFFKTRDWNNYARDLDVLATQYASAWSAAPAVRRLRDRVILRGASAPARVTGSVAGAPITAEDQALATELVTATNVVSGRNYSGLWILPTPETAGISKPGKDPPPETVIDRIRKRGMRSVPLLIALFNDDCLTYADSNYIGRGGGCHDSYDPDGGSPMSEVQVQQVYQQLRRPMTRGEMAEALLAGLVLPAGPDSDDSPRRDVAPDERKQEVARWYEQNKDKTPAELARLYLNKGDYSQQMAAMSWLLVKPTEPDIQEIEAFILKEDNSPGNDRSYLLQNYIRLRGANATNLVERYIAVLQKQMAAPKGDKEGMFKDDAVRRNLDSTVKRLRGMVGAAATASANTNSSEQILAQVLAGTTNLVSVREDLWRAFGREKKDKDQRVTSFLNAALTATNGVEASQFVDMLGSSRYYERRYCGPTAYAVVDECEAYAEGETDEERPDPAPHAALWRKLLDDQRSVVRGRHQPQDAENTSLGSHAAHIILGYYKDEAFEEMDWQEKSVLSAFGPLYARIIRERANAILDGKTGDDLPTLPSADSVTSEDRAKLVQALMTATPAKLDAMIQKLSLNEHMALVEQAEDNESLNAKLLPVAHRVTAVDLDVQNATAWKEIAGLKDRQIDRQAIERLVEICKTQAAKGTNLAIRVYRQTGARGIRLLVSDDPSAIEDSRRTYTYRSLTRPRMAPLAIVFASIGSSGGDSGREAFWFAGKTESPPPPPAGKQDLLKELDTEVTADMERRQEDSVTEFMEEIDRFCAGKGNVLQVQIVNVRAIPKPEPKKKPKPKPAVDETELPVPDEVNVDPFGMMIE